MRTGIVSRDRRPRPEMPALESIASPDCARRADARLLRASAWRSACGAWALSALVSAAIAAWMHPPRGWLLVALAFAALMCALVLALLPTGRASGSDTSGSSFGAPNQVTLTRLCLQAPLVAQAIMGPSPVAWWLIVLATLVAISDSLDGWLARRGGLSSAFGARFDMETDALLVLVLSVLVWQSGRAGIWVLAAGLMRYALVAACALWPWLRAPLPPSARRKAVCVAVIVALITALGPIVPEAMASGLATAAVTALAGSFGWDLLWLNRERRRASCIDGSPPFTPS